MSPRNIILLVIALAIAGITALMMNSQMEEPVQEVVKRDNLVLAAKSNIPMGGFVRTAEHLEWKEIPKENIDPAVHIRESKESIGSFEGAVARRSYRPGDIITEGSLIKPGSGGFLSAVLNPGMRAVSIAVNATSGNAGFIFPGDRVDLILSHRVETKDENTGDKSEYVFSNTPIKNARVLAVDQQLDNPENKAILAKTVTIEVTSKQAEQIQIATEMGKISFALRSISDSLPPEQKAGENETVIENTEDFLTAIEGENPTPESFTTDAEVSPALGRGGRNANVRVIRGDKSDDQTFYRNTQ